jgi:hypothetical protein
MNVSYLKQALLLVLLTPLLAHSQFIRPYPAVKLSPVDTFEHMFVTFNHAAIVKFPAHSSHHAIENLGGGQRKLVYVPEQGFSGRDTILIEYVRIINGPPEYIGFAFLVYPSLVEAHADYVVTNFDTQVTVSPMANDISSNGGLELGHIFIERHGSAQIVGEDIVFTPTPGFSGIAQVGYTCCNGDDVCDKAVINILVLPESGLELIDTVHIQLPKNTPLDLMVQLDGFDNIEEDPMHGDVVEVEHDVVRYTPSVGFTGNDAFVLTRQDGGNTYKRVFLLEVINTLPDRKYAMNDVVYTHVNTPVTFNVLSNDIGYNNIYNAHNIKASRGDLVYLGQGEFTYTPPVNFKGKATFTYSVSPGMPWPVESALVEINVDDFRPMLATYSFQMVADKSFVLRYAPPVEPWDFDIKVEPLHGSLTVHDGEQTITVDNQDITGYNLVVYTPDAGFSGDVDEFELEYCAAGSCRTVKFEIDVLPNPNPNEDPCHASCVWPGDANNDGIVNIRDLLAVGYGMGVYGPDRDNPSTEWSAQFSDNWEDPYVDMYLDLKYVDTDGDGLVTAADTLAISNAYFNTHKVTTIQSHQLTTDIDLRFLVRDTSLYGPDTIIILDILYGLSNKPAYDAYGFTFEVDFADVINLEDKKPRVVYYEDSWLSRQRPTLEMFRRVSETAIHSGYTKTDGVGTVGYGPVGFVIVDDFEGVRPPMAGLRAVKNPYEITIRNITVMTGDGQYHYLPDQKVQVGPRQPVEAPANDDALLHIFPNPTAGDATLYMTDGRIMDRVEVFSMQGHLVHESGHIATPRYELQTGTMSNGLYLLRIRSGQEVFTRKLHVTR